MQKIIIEMPQEKMWHSFVLMAFLKGFFSTARNKRLVLQFLNAKKTSISPRMEVKGYTGEDAIIFKHLNDAPPRFIEVVELVDGETERLEEFEFITLPEHPLFSDALKTQYVKNWVEGRLLGAGASNKRRMKIALCRLQVSAWKSRQSIEEEGQFWTSPELLSANINDWQGINLVKWLDND